MLDVLVVMGWFCVVTLFGSMAGFSGAVAPATCKTLDQPTAASGTSGAGTGPVEVTHARHS
jgi:hypothetical protein